MQKQILQYIVGPVFLLLLVPCLVLGESARSLVESGNEAFANGDYVLSLQNYDKASETEPDSAIVLFNRGDALYKQKKFAEALNVFEQAAAKARESDDPGLEAQSRYNMGNSSFRRAEILSREDLQKAFEEYKRSSNYFQSAEKLKPGFSEATQNLEVSRIAAKQVEELIRKQQQQAQQQEQAREELQKELENLQQEQQGAANESRDLARAEQQKGADNAAAQQAEDLADKQKSITDRTRAAEEKIEQLKKGQNAEQPEQSAKEHVKKAVEKQESAQENLQQNKPADAQKEQEDAARELQKALQQLEQSQEQKQEKESPGSEGGNKKAEAEAEQQKQQEQQEPEESNESNGEQMETTSKANSGESPEDIINEEIDNRKYHSVRGGTGYTPVDKDW